ncbi:zinc ribbon domain-containing protein [Rubellicoccus peritrichatus]|uniref:C4-type zinc ribbon domain-containing protein n=1 Tax=Rubellicoccus peritrichatus TaxID=3080537 RepID=A0AAQ3LA76_9BACT|nr:C4-type zinc ribbon domain-containing protein [Puniceicoccus sp. CR14]WOO41946.1 C4-type zinc ribbon domain-containing protein [Puniceicoccus sp. CR14]
MQPEIEKLLILQDRDGRRLSIETQITRLPREVEELEGKIKVEKDAIAAGALELKELEVKRNEIDQEVKVREEKIRKYLNQQLEVKKNDEYQALTHEIELMQKEIGELEEQEIAAMLEIDEKKSEYSVETDERMKRIGLFEGEVGNLKERENALKSELTEARQDSETAKADVDETYLKHYEQILGRGIRFPLVVPLDGSKCTGCHLKVSGEVEAAVRHKQGPMHCDNCSRIVYWD